MNMIKIARDVPFFGLFNYFVLFFYTMSHVVQLASIHKWEWLQMSGSPASTSQMLSLQVCTSTPSNYWNIFYHIYSQWIHLQNTSTPKSRGTVKGEGAGAKTLYEPEDQRVCYTIVSPKNVRSCTHKVSWTWLLNVNWTRLAPMSIMDGGQSQRPQLYTKSTDNWGKLGVGGEVFPREEHTNWLPSAKWSVLETYIQVTLY